MDRAEHTKAASIEDRPWRRATGWFVLLGTFFYLSYGLSNWLASQRTHVPAIVFAWEHVVPFITWTIVPF
jgi:hypothetical protein